MDFQGCPKTPKMIPKGAQGHPRTPRVGHVNGGHVNASHVNGGHVNGGVQSLQKP